MENETNFFSLSAREEKRSPEILDWVKKHFAIQHNVVYARSKFNTRNQRIGESTDEYFAALFSLAERCNYGHLKEELIRDRIIVGIQHKELTEQLIYMPDLTLDKTLDAVRMFEERLGENLKLNETKNDCSPIDLKEEKPKKRRKSKREKMEEKQEEIKFEHLRLEANNGLNPDDTFRFRDDKTLVPKIKKEKFETEDLFRLRVLDILNNPTWEKLATILEQIMELPIETESRLTSVIDLIFEKAADEPNCCDIYASVCKHIMTEVANDNFNFMELLSIKSQSELEKDMRDEINRDNKIKQMEKVSEDEKKKMKEELEEEDGTVRRGCFGNIRLIGELYKLGMLTQSIVHNCVTKLLKQGNENSLERLCMLMTNIGEKLEENAKSEKSQLKKMNSYFSKIKQFMNSSDTSCEARFMLQDLKALRMRNWVRRTEDKSFKTIEQYYIESQQILAQHPQQSVDNRDRKIREKQYDRDFLISLQSKPLSLQKPKGLPNLDIIRDKPLMYKLPDLLSTQVPTNHAYGKRTTDSVSRPEIGTPF